MGLGQDGRILTLLSVWLLSNVVACSVGDMEYHIAEQGNANIRLRNNGDYDSIRAPRRRRSLIYPGTKWCGDGNRAENYNDLGSKKQLDQCCRMHDHCPDNIPSKEEKHGLHNVHAFTVSHCECDEKFRHCLRNLSSTDGIFVGQVYFNIYPLPCFFETFPANCVDRSSVTEKCIEYSFNTSQPIKWQFFNQSSWEEDKMLWVVPTPTSPPIHTTKQVKSTTTTVAVGKVSSGSSSLLTRAPGVSALTVIFCILLVMCWKMYSTFCS